MILAIALAGASPARGGSFMEAPGHWQTIAAMRVTSSRLAYDERGALTKAPLYRKVETSWYSEYGLNQDVTLVINPAIRDVRLETDSGGALAGAGISSLEAGARWRLGAFGSWTVSFQTLERIPVKSDPFLELENRPRTEFRFGLGSPAIVERRAGFVDVSGAWIRRAEKMPDEVRLDVVYGWWEALNQLMILRLESAFFPESGVRHAARAHKVEVSTVYKLSPEWSVQLGSFFSTGGQTTRRESGTVWAVWRRF